MDWTLPLDAIDLERAMQLRARFTACCSEIAANDSGVDAVAAAIAKHLSPTTSADLPPPARPIWQDRVAHLLKADPAKPLSERAVRSIRSWPSARAVELHAALSEIEAILVEAENEAHHEAIYVEISRTYS